MPRALREESLAFATRPEAAGRAGAHTEMDMKRGRVVVAWWLWAFSALAVQTAFASTRAYVADRVLEQLRESGSARVIVSMWDSALPEARAKDWRERVPAIQELGRRVRSAAPRFRVERSFVTQPFLVGTVNRAGLDQLLASPVVEAVYPVRTYRASLDVSGPLIGQPQAESAGYSGAGVGIAILDTGIDYTHPDLGGAPFPNSKVVGGYDFVNGDNDPMDDDLESGHGTHVAGIAAGTGSQYRGIAPAAKLLACKVLDSRGYGDSGTIMQAIDWCITNRTAFNIRVINMSLGDATEYTDPAQCDNSAEAAVIADAVDQGITVVAAAGNEGYLDGVAFPACVSDVIAVGATYKRSYSETWLYGECSDTAPQVDSVACFSSRGELLDLYAPGAIIMSAQVGGGYHQLAGTSMATPHVAGAAACLASQGITDPAAIRARLKRTGVQIVDDLSGVASPRVDLVRAINNQPTSGPDLVVTSVSTPVSSGSVGDPVTVSLTVVNQGDAPSPACTALVVLSANSIASPRDYVVATVALPTLAAGAAFSSASIAGVVPSVPGGTYKLGAFADSGYGVAEKDETNNGLTGADFQVLTPGATVVSSTVPAYMLKGSSHVITVQMRNSGTVAWTAGEFHLRSQSPAGTTRWGIESVNLPGGATVPPGATVTFTFDVTAPADPGAYPCHWQMAKGDTYFGEVATGATKTLVVDDADYGQDAPAVSGNRVSYVDYSGLYRDYLIPAIGVKDLDTQSRTILPDDINFPRDAQGWPYPPYSYFDVSSSFYPDISGTWVTWFIDDRPDNADSPTVWYYQVTAYNLATPDVLPLRIVWGNWDSLYPAIDGNLVVWEDYRNDPDHMVSANDFLEDNADIYICDLRDTTGTDNHYVIAHPLCTAPGPQLSPRISGNLVVWEDWRDGSQADIYAYDLTVDSDGDGIPNWKESVRPNPDPAEIRLTATPWSEMYPDVSGRKVVWLDTERLYQGTARTIDVYALDLDTLLETPVATDPPALRDHARISGDQVVWHDFRGGQSDVYWANLSDPWPIPIAASPSGEDMPAINGPRNAYSVYRRQTTLSYIYDPNQPPEQISWDVYNVVSQRMLTNGWVGVHTFPDVNTDYWAWPWIEAVAAAGIARGYPDGTYGPTVTVTRDQMAVYVARAMAGSDAAIETPTGPATFPDVPEDHWAFKYIEYCHTHDIVAGYPDGTYGPDLPVTRGAMAVFIARGEAGGDTFFDTYTPPSSPSFPDVTADNAWAWCYKYVEYIKAHGVTSGYPDGLYHPEFECSRDQMAVYVTRAFGLPL